MKIKLETYSRGMNRIKGTERILMRHEDIEVETSHLSAVLTLIEQEYFEYKDEIVKKRCWKNFYRYKEVPTIVLNSVGSYTLYQLALKNGRHLCYTLENPFDLEREALGDQLPPHKHLTDTGATGVPL